MRRILFTQYIIIAWCLVAISYGFLDLNLTLTDTKPLSDIFTAFRTFARSNRPIMTIAWTVGLVCISALYVAQLRVTDYLKQTFDRFLLLSVAGIALIFSLSYPAHSYDIFNYITTAKVTFHYQENPYLVMPIEFLNEPYLTFTRAANKFALYGPVWILFSAIPYYMGAGNIWLTILAFKMTNALIYLLFSYVIFIVTKSVKNVIFFAYNPLILMEVLIGGHNDILMMVLSIIGIYGWYHGKKITGLLTFALSWFVKGATIVLLPMLFIKNISWEKFLKISYWILVGVFFVIAPLREELYPWYAVWFITIASLLTFEKNTFIYWITIILSFSLELRHLPYMWMGYYEGPGPLLRMVLTVVPVAIFICIYIFLSFIRSKKNSS